MSKTAEADIHEQMVADLAHLVSIPSVTDDRKAVEEALTWILDRASSFGMRTRVLCDGQIGEIEIGDGDEVFGVLVHTDVVPAGVRENWETEPFCLTRKDGRMYGRGVQDDKGPLIASLYAMRSLLDNNEKMDRKIRMIIGTREETDWEDIHRYVEEMPLPDHGFTPDGDFPICNIEKGILELEFFIPYKPGDEGWHLTHIDSGDMNNTVPGKADAEMTLFRQGIPVEKREFHASGKSIHSGEPELGDNAIYHLIDEMSIISPAPSRAWSALMLLREKFFCHDGEGVGIKSTEEYYNGEYVSINTISVNRLEIRGEELWFRVDIRYPYGTDPSELEEALGKVVGPLDGRVERVMDLPPSFVKSDTGFIKVLAEVYEEFTGEKGECITSTGGTYAQAMPGIVTWGPTFPGSRDTCHEENEFMEEKNFITIYEMYSEALRRLVKSQRR